LDAATPTARAPAKPGPQVTARPDFLQGHSRLGQGLVDDRPKALKMAPRSQLRDDPAVAGVEIGLRGDNIRPQAAAGKHRRGGLVARGLDAEDEHTVW